MSLTREHLSKESSFPTIAARRSKSICGAATIVARSTWIPSTSILGTGSHIQTWRYGVNESLGDCFIWLQIPLHYGTYWGLGLKTLWAFLGLSIPIITITGVLMYWNRVLRHKWKRLKYSGRRVSDLSADPSQPGLKVTEGKLKSY